MTLTTTKMELKESIANTFSKIELDTNLTAVIDEVNTIQEVFKRSLTFITYTIKDRRIVFEYKLSKSIQFVFEIDYEIPPNAQSKPEPKPEPKLSYKKIRLCNTVCTLYTIEDKQIRCKFQGKDKVVETEFTLIKHTLATYATGIKVRTYAKAYCHLYKYNYRICLYV